MAAKKAAPPSKRSKKKKRPSKPEPARNLRNGVLIVVLLLAITGVLAVLGHQFIGPFQTAVLPPAPRIAPPVASTPERAPIPSANMVHGRVPHYEVYPKSDMPAERTEPALPAGKPRVAIIIDDLGYDRRLANKFATLAVVRTFSVFPNGPFRTQTMKTAADNGIELMLHLPMEPEEYPAVDPGPDALLMSQTPDELIGRLNALLDGLPLAVGVNNHMGSRLTANEDRMNQVFSVLKRRGLFFIDSRTTVHTMCRQSARLLQLPFAQRDIFLDHDQDPASVRRQVERLLAIAKKHGEAVGIGHPYSVTFDTLNDMTPSMKAAADFVPASALVRTIPYS
ncbi:MAG: divergent polysaccharide deacetylase family protein [Pseudomonadota bacterium]